MTAYIIQAHSNKKDMTVSNVPKPRLVNEGEGPIPDVIPFSSPAEFNTQEEADAQAVKFAEWLNSNDHEGAWDWVGQAFVD